jgi:hypothetical protein
LIQGGPQTRRIRSFEHTTGAERTNQASEPLHRVTRR